jgi:hypothetical protein
MTIGERYGDLFQMSYITRDLDAAMAHARDRLGIPEFRVSASEIDVLSYGKPRKLAVRAAMANIGSRQFEIIEPVSGAVEVYTDEVDLAGNILNFHHVAIAVRGGYAEWQELLAEVAESGDGLAYLFPIEQHEHQGIAFCYVDTRERIGHFTEFLWADPALEDQAALPRATDQEHST